MYLHHAVRRHKDVRRLEVAVDDAALVKVAAGFDDLREQPQADAHLYSRVDALQAQQQGLLKEPTAEILIKYTYHVGRVAAALGQPMRHRVVAAELHLDVHHALRLEVRRETPG